VARKIVLVLKRSQDYDFDYVDRLTDSLDLYCSNFELDVIEEPPWPRWWAKMAIFDPSVTGDFLYLDLDTVVRGNIDSLFIGRLTVLADFNLPRPNYMASGVMFVPESDRDQIWRSWIADPEFHIRKHGGNGDGGFLSQFIGPRAGRKNCPVRS
jgi:hypothetical protein